MSPLAHPVLSIVVTALLMCAWQMPWFLWLKPRKVDRFLRQQGLNGTPYSLLFPGLRETVREAFLHVDGAKACVELHGLRHAQGNISRINEFEKPRLKALGDVFLYGLPNIEGDKWAKHRKIMDPAVHLEKLKLVVTTTCSRCEEMMRTWEEQSVGGEVDVWPHLERLSSDVISRAALGSSYEQGKRIFLLQKELMRLPSKTSQFAFIPGSSFLPTTLRKRVSEIDRKLKGFLKDMVITREKALKEGGAEKEDLLGSILKSNRKEIKKSGHQKGMSVEDVVQDCKVFYLSCQDTTTLFLTWTLILLSKYKKWQDRARKEVFQVFGDNKPDFDGLSQLKMVTGVFIFNYAVYLNFRRHIPEFPELTVI